MAKIVAQTGKQKKAAAEAAAKAGATPAKEPKQAVAIIVPNAKALSVDVGPRVIASLAKVGEMDEQIKTMTAQYNAKRYDMLSATTEAIVKAAKADLRINLGAAFSGDPKQMNALNDQLGIVLGTRIVVTVGKGDKATQKVVGSDAVSKFFPRKSDDPAYKESAEYKRANTTRSNWLHMLKKCSQAASGIIETNSVMKIDKASGTLQLTGPAIKSAFGAATVSLDEKQTVGEGKAAKKLDARPSFTAIANMGAKAAGKVLVSREQSRKNVLAAAGAPVDLATAIVSLCNTLVTSINKLPETVTDAQRKALESVRSAIDTKLGD